LFLFSQLALCGIVQTGNIATNANPSLTMNGAQAIIQNIGSPYGVAADKVGGFYFSVLAQNRIYRVAADGSISLTAGVGTKGYSGDGGGGDCGAAGKSTWYGYRS
jgi:hypothetical protein